MQGFFVEGFFYRVQADAQARRQAARLNLPRNPLANDDGRHVCPAERVTGCHGAERHNTCANWFQDGFANKVRGGSCYKAEWHNIWANWFQNG